MEKLIKPIVGLVDQFMPGYKTYFIMVMSLGMMVCQMLGHHEFTPESWGIVGIMGGITWKMGQDRKKGKK